MHNETIAWDDLQYVLYVARTGSIGAAAKQLGVNRTTVLRRINRIEETLEYSLFDRRASGYWLEPGAEELLQAAQEVEEKVSQLHRQIKNKDLSLQGDIRVSTTDPVLHMFLAPHLATFRERHPNIHVTVIVANHHISLSQREVDVSIRGFITPPENLVCHHLMSMEFGVYASEGYLQRNDSQDMAEHRWIASDPPSPVVGEWVIERFKEHICFRVDTYTGIRTAIELGIGLGVLPTLLAEQYPHLRRVFQSEPDVSLDLWIVTHPDLVRSARVNALYEHICHAIHITKL